MKAVFDSSTLILLIKIDLLKRIYNYVDVLISRSIYEEVVIKGKNYNKTDALIIEKEINENNILIKKVENKNFVNQLLHDFKFNKGEAEIIALALQEKINFIFTDDKEAIKACKVYNLKFITALGVLIKMYEDKIISKDDALNKIDLLNTLGYYSKEIINQALGEIK